MRENKQESDIFNKAQEGPESGKTGEKSGGYSRNRFCIAPMMDCTGYKIRHF